MLDTLVRSNHISRPGLLHTLAMPPRMILDFDTGTDDAVALKTAALSADIELVGAMTDGFGVVVVIVLSIGAVIVLGTFMRRSSPSARATRAFDQLEITDVADLEIGRRARLRGHFEAAAEFVTPRYSAQPAIAVRTTMRHQDDAAPRWAVEEECRGFWLLHDGMKTLVDIDGPVHLLLDRSPEIHHFVGREMPSWMSPVWARNGLSFDGVPGETNSFEVDEALLFPGDLVEVLGLVNEGRDVDGQRSIVVIGADPEHGIAIRRGETPTASR